MKPNIVFLVIDALRYDRLGICGYRPIVTPNLDRLAENSVNCTHCFANGCVTQVAFPSIFTSTLPFDYGGYNEGIQSRPDSFPELLREDGYQTFGVVTGHPASSHYGYGRGFDEFIDLIDLYQWFRSIFKTSLREIFENWQEGKLNESETHEMLKDRYGRFLDDSEKYIVDMEARNLPAFGRARLPLLRQVRAERELLYNRPSEICAKLLELDQNYQFALGTPRVTNTMRRKFRWRAMFREQLNRRFQIISDRHAFEMPAVNDQFDKFLTRRNTDQPFFAFLHYFDLHEAKTLLSTWSLWKLKNFPASVRNARHDRPHGQGGLLYDVSLSMIDREIGRLFDLFGRHRLTEDTILVITSDHGADAGPPLRGVGSEMSQRFFDEFLRVPLIITGPDIPNIEINSLVSHLDIGPTILDIADIESPHSFQGNSIFRQKNLSVPHVWSENAGNGRCDFSEKPLYFGLRTVDSKLVYEAISSKITEREYYDLAQDPLEQTNLANAEREIEMRKHQLGIVSRRVAELRQANK